MMIRRRVPGLIAVMMVGVALASCAEPARWHKPGTSLEQWHRDRAECQGRARARAERHLREQGSQANSPVYGSGNTLERSMAQYDARTHQRALFESCLSGRGYSKTKPVPETKA